MPSDIEVLRCVSRAFKVGHALDQSHLLFDGGVKLPFRALFISVEQLF